MEERALRRLLPGPPDPRLKIWGWDEREMHYLAEEMIDFGLDPDAIKTGTAVALTAHRHVRRDGLTCVRFRARSDTAMKTKRAADAE